MSCIHKFNCLLALSLFAVFSLARAEPMLNGIAVHQELGKEIFIGALYSESLSDNADALLSSTQPMRMELKIVSPEGIATRRFSGLWIEGMAINNKPDVLTAQADNMVKFDGLFKGRLLPNDHVTFASLPGRGVQVSVNNVVLGNVGNAQFFSMLLSTWIGRVPLSSDYRDGLLKVGNVDASLRNRFEAIKPSAARIADIQAWNGPTTADVAEAKANKSSAKASSSANNKSSVDIKLATKPEIPTLPAVIEQPKLTASVAASSAPAVAAAKSSAAAVATAKRDDEEDEDAGPALTAQSLLARQFYVSDLLKKIFSKTRYPNRALERGQEGSVRVAVVIDRQGNVISMKVLEESKYELLNKEAREAISRSAPFPAMPAALAGTRFEFTVPIRFTLPKR